VHIVTLLGEDSGDMYLAPLSFTLCTCPLLAILSFQCIQWQSQSFHAKSYRPPSDSSKLGGALFETMKH
jgi:hypothetical protein